MASSRRHLPLLLLLASAFIVLNVSVGVDARPCKIMFISYTADDPLFGVPQIRDVYPCGKSTFFSVHRVFRFPYDGVTDVLLDIPRPDEINRSGAVFDLGLEGIRSSFQKRAGDILVVVAWLLFGVGCGALTTTFMCFVWSIVTNRRKLCCGADDSDDDEDVENPKKMGYVTIPTVAEGYEGN